MSKLQKIASLCMLIVLGLSIIQQPVTPVAAVEPQQPVAPVAAVEPQQSSSAGSWSAAFSSPLKSNYGYMPGRPIEWNGTLYANILSLANNASDAGVGYWNGQQWLKIDGLTGLVDSVAVHQNRLYAVGRLKLGGKDINLAYWDGNMWTAMPHRFNGAAYLNLASYNSQLYVGGDNLVIDGQAYGALALWDGLQWHAAAAGIDGVVFNMLVRPDGLYLGGSFLFNGQGTGLLYWNGSQWQNVGGGVYGLVFDLEWANSQLYISGQFTSTLVPTMKNIAAWNGTSWNTFGTGIVSATHNLALVDGELYALSKKSYNYPNPARFQLHRWDATQWTTLSTMQEQSLNGSWLRLPDAVLLNYNQQLFAFGPFMSSQAIANSSLYTWGDWALRWDGAYWLSMTPSGIVSNGNEGPSVVLTTDNEDLYALANKMHWNIAWATLAHLNAQNHWQSLVAYTYQPALGNPQALQKYQQSFFSIYNNNLYQAGNNTWNSAGNAYVTSLAQANNLLYVAGSFEQFNGVTAHNLVTWNGTQWQALNTPASFDRVTIVEAHGNAVYISDGTQLARWDGTQWTTLATNVVNIGEIEPTANGVYIAGTFSSVGGVSAPKIAYWNGSTWAGLTGEINGTIHDLEMGADGLYVAGNFRGLTNGIVSGGILRWDGAAWHGLAGGVQASIVSTYPGKVYSLAATPTRMLMQGSFSHVGNQYESFQIAAWEYGNEPLIKAKADYAITYRPQSVALAVLDNDWSDQPTQLQLMSVTTPSHGTVAINGSSIVYTPAAQFQGTDTFTYTVRDPIHAVTAQAPVRVHVWNGFPTLSDQEREILPFTDTLLDPLRDVFDPNNDNLTITQASVLSGTVTIVNNNLRYTPPNQQYFSDVVTYTVSDGHGWQQTARMTLRSLDVIIFPHADHATTYRPHAVTVDVVANDWSLYNEPLELIDVHAVYGTATISANQVHYQPTTTLQDSAILEYTVRNPTRGVTATGTLIIEVQNHVPTVAPLTLTVAPNSTTIVDVLAHAIDLNGDPLVILNPSAELGTVAVVNNQLRYTAPINYPFTDTISYVVMDDHSGSRTGTITVNSGTYQRVFLPYTSK
ncbi:Ig-like domain-containing protein [Herpetosiphon giganteus]|uniref:Ig-like domain-containing protein n=1 Tax=Herpetosiphon giganteus TaxID=2029754 RepID=UPI00195C900D|nr:Ig-like domain-containing protein [Herpetosiphon giganteus]MBM7842744.1 hypothetical protein [Herpetosiphon giganteus]